MSHTPTRRTAPARRRRLRATPPLAPCPQIVASPAPPAETVSAQRYGPCEDRALYRCHCGCDFHAAVSTTVGCPACGAAQDW